MSSIGQGLDGVARNFKSITKGYHYESLPDKDLHITIKRKTIRKHMLKICFQNNPMIRSFTVDDLYQLYKLYDKQCFNNQLSNMLTEKKRKIEFGTMIISEHKAGDHCRKGNIHTIRISSSMIGNLFTNGERSIKANGIIIYDRLGAIITIFEHEIMHLYCSLKDYIRKIKQGPGKMYYSPHGKLFQELVFRYFGHTDFRHNFDQGEASNQLTKADCKIGMNIYFKSKKYGKIYGKIIKINIKRCKVDTEEGSTYDVPFGMLRKTDKTVTVPERQIVNLVDLKSKYRIGITVRFRHNRNVVSGTIIKCNRKRVRVDSTIGIYNVPYESLE